MSKYTEVLILCEDLQQEVFTRTFLVCCNINPKRIRIRKNVSGSGEHFVREQYPIEVSTYRKVKNKKENIGLVVFIDADTNNPNQIQKELDDSLQSSLQPRRQSEENIAIFIPKREIETWIYYLMGDNVDEDTEYHHWDDQGVCKPFVKQLARNRNKPLPPNAPPSLQAACEELDRIL